MKEMDSSLSEQPLQSSELSKLTRKHILMLNLAFLALSMLGAVAFIIVKTH